ncbi:UDP-N-acetylmuramoyl-L-alanine--D-glutamate ligase [Candidatus Gracilibacteria bacterium]|nr:UDP-N-acetylmuramoyl-L-alanine--D-glutamate ligase [Candidatus Gracilibacteria bacterium]
MYLIYGKGAVGQAVKKLCEFQKIPYEICDDSDAPQDFDKYEYIIPSPGIPPSHRIYSTKKILGELNFAMNFLEGKHTIITVTGTDGKSTTASMAYEILSNIEGNTQSVFLSGNFGTPFSQTVCEILEKNITKSTIIVEVSSFMGYGLDFNFRTKNEGYLSDFTIFTNLRSDHLDWHKDLREYIDSKWNFVQKTKKRAIINSQLTEFIKKEGISLDFDEEKIRFFGLDENEEKIFKDRTDGQNIIISGRKKYLLSDTKFSGNHNAMNLLSVGMLCNEMKICSKKVQKTLSMLSPLAHRLELITTKNDIKIVEDSKSTSAQSLEAALSSFGDTKNLLIIVGGHDKGDDFDYLLPRFQARVKYMVCIGDTAQKFENIAKQANIEYYLSENMQEAVKWLFDKGEKDDVLILSPGCSSFGLFKNYLDRANQFREAVESL